MYKHFISPILDHLDSEKWHVRACDALHGAESSYHRLKMLEKFCYKGKKFVHPRLKNTVAGISFENPLIVGAGWDKRGVAVRGLWQLGFGGVEVGSVLRNPQLGNAKPRQFMLSPGVCLNHLGFNSPGMIAVRENLKRYHGNSIPIGLNIGKNAIVPDHNAAWAYASVISQFTDIASYFVINVSSPNTTDLRGLQQKQFLDTILREAKNTLVKSDSATPLFVKIAPEPPAGICEEEYLNDIVEVACTHKLAGIIACNTTVNTKIKQKYGKKWSDAKGGISGNDVDYRNMSTQIISKLYALTKGSLAIIGVGGIHDTSSALEKIMAGASLIQVVTGIRSEGTTIAGRINRGLVEFMDEENVSSIEELIGQNSTQKWLS